MTDQEFFSKFEYKTGWDIDYSYQADFNNDAITIRVTAKMTNLQCPFGREPTKIVACEAVSMDLWQSMNIKDKINLVKTIISNMELHEMDEWLRFDGNYIKKPHPSLNR